MTHLKFYIKSVLSSLVFFILLILFIKNIYSPALKITIEVVLTFSIGSLCYSIFCKTNRAAFLPISVVLFLLPLYLLGGQCFSRNFVSLHFFLGGIMMIEIAMVVLDLYWRSQDYFLPCGNQIWVLKWKKFCYYFFVCLFISSITFLAYDFVSEEIKKLIIWINVLFLILIIAMMIYAKLRCVN